ncbi:winged helix-turn-helix domain-containing protein [Aeromonas finlandensis]|uniref:winged helix-turn-helix domain-containing protein n=1 Tax=Aeromonas finlandensis TaxID=1543375 RepID=UPI00051B1BBC|nr:hypothetical protein [Aeromonas finlandensis]
MEHNDLVFNLENRVNFLPGKGCLVNHQGDNIPLSENSLRFLLLLLEGVTEKDAIIERVWREQNGAISESSYYGQLHILRNSFVQIGLDKNLIKTIPRKGVRYIGQFEKLELCGKQVHSPDERENNKALDMVLPASETDGFLSDKNEEPIELSKYSLGNQIARHIKKIGMWNIFISALAIISVCWLTLLTFVLLTSMAE